MPKKSKFGDIPGESREDRKKRLRSAYRKVARQKMTKEQKKLVSLQNAAYNARYNERKRRAMEEDSRAEGVLPENAVPTTHGYIVREGNRTIHRMR